MNSITLPAPAKVNLFLKVLNKRKDGYHNIITLFERISLSDRIKISKIDRGIRVSSDKFITLSPQSNLAYKAARALVKRCKIKAGVSINITKRIPIAAGLGGGSSDAASVLVGMNKLFGLKLSKRNLAAIGERLGADIPFFILDTAFAVGRGKGGNLKKVALRVRPWHLVIYPGFKVAAKDIYEYFDASTGSASTLSKAVVRFRPRRRVDKCKALTEPKADVRINPSLTLRQKLRVNPEQGRIFTASRVEGLTGLNNLGALEHMLYNDLESIVSSRFRTIADMIERLAVSLGKKAILSGSGPSVFCLYDTRKEALEAKRRLVADVPSAEKKKWQTFIVRTKI